METVKLKEGVKLKKLEPLKRLLDPKFVPKGAMEVLETYVWAQNRQRFARLAKTSRSTLYNAFEAKNPTIKTIAKVVHTAAYEKEPVKA